MNKTEPWMRHVNKHYARDWHHVCVGWLGWSEPRFKRFLRAYNVMLDGRGIDFFYHYPPLDYMIRLLVTDEFEERLQKRVRNYRYGTPESVYFRSEILDVILGVPRIKGRFDWAAAKERVEKYLALYREKLPSSKTVTDYEKWVLGFGTPQSIQVAKLLAKSAVKPLATKAS